MNNQSVEHKQFLEVAHALRQGDSLVLALLQHHLQDIAEVIVFILSLFPVLHARLQQDLHYQSCQLHISLKALSDRSVVSLQRTLLLFLLHYLVVIVLQIRQDHPHRPVQLIDLQFPKRAWFLMSMEKVDEIDDLKHHLRDLEVIQNHIVFHHELEGPMMIIEDQIVGVSFYFFFSAHICWDLALDASSVLDGDAVEPDEIGAGIGLELFQVEQEGIYFADGDVLVGVYHIWAIIEAGFVNLISPLHCIGLVYLTQDLYLIIAAYDVLLNLFDEFRDIFFLGLVDELVDHCMVLLLLSLLEGNDAVITSKLLVEAGLHDLKGLSGGHSLAFVAKCAARQELFDLFYLAVYFLGRDELQPQSRQVLTAVDNLIIYFVQLQSTVIYQSYPVLLKISVLVSPVLVLGLLQGDLYQRLFVILLDLLLYGRGEEQQEEVKRRYIGLTEWYFFLHEVLQQPALHVFVFMDGLHYQKGEVWIFFIFALPILQGLNVMLLIHILAALPQLLIVNNIDVGALFTHVLHSSRIVLQTLYYQLLVDLLLKAEGQQRYLLVGQEVLDIPIGLLPLLLAVGFEEDPFL